MCVSAAKLSRRLVYMVYSTLSPIDVLECLRGMGMEAGIVSREAFFMEEIRVVKARWPSR